MLRWFADFLIYASWNASGEPIWTKKLNDSLQIARPDLLIKHFSSYLLTGNCKFPRPLKTRLEQKKCLQYLKTNPLLDLANLSSAAIQRYMSKTFPTSEQSILKFIKKMIQSCMNFKQQGLSKKIK